MSSFKAAVSGYELGLRDRVFIVTGGSRGIGKAIVLELVKYGAKVIFTYLKASSEADTIVNQAASLGGEVFAIKADVRDLSQTRDVVSMTLQRFNQIDGLINNAGIIRDKALMLMEPEDWDDVIQTNLTGTFNTCRAIITEFMKQRNGSIVNISSIAGIAGNARQVNYSASKAGVIGLTKALAKEVAGYGIRVNAVAPGYIQTDMISTFDEKTVKNIEGKIPLKRLGLPEEVAGLVVSLVSPASSYITGQVFVIDGGVVIS